MGQSDVAAMTSEELVAAERSFRSEIEAAIDNTGLTLVSWEGMERDSLGGRIALVKHYRFRYPAKSEMTMESYGVYLGGRSIQIRIQFSTASAPTLKEEIDGVRQSISLALGRL
jgi:hypothetical protein